MSSGNICHFVRFYQVQLQYDSIKRSLSFEVSYGKIASKSFPNRTKQCPPLFAIC